MRILRPKKNEAGGAPRTQCGVSFDRTTASVALADRDAAGRISVRRVAAFEPMAAQITSDVVLSTIGGWSGHTDRTSLPVSAADDDEQILSLLLEAQAQNEGTVNLRFTFTRTLDGRVVLTQALRAEAEESVSSLRSWLSSQRVTAAAPVPLGLDTATRSVARLWLSGPVVRDELKPGATVAILVVGEDGYGLALWGANAGLVYETGERFKPGANEVQLASHITSKLSNFVAPATVDKLGLPPVKHLVVALSERIRPHLVEFLNTAEALREIAFERLLMESPDGGDSIALDLHSALAVGAVSDPDLVPTVNLSAELTDQIAEVQRLKQTDALTVFSRRREAVAFACLTALAFGLLFVGAGWALRRADASTLDRQIASEKATAARLKQANADYESAKANFAVITNLISQITTLRAKQADAYQLLVELNSRWPRGTPWYVSEVNSTGNQLEVKGRARDEQAVTMFVRALENSEGLFANVTEKHDEPNRGNAGPAPLAPTPAAQKTQPVVEFEVRAIYSPTKPAANAAAPAAAPAPPAAR
ncbi:MAG: PilN domain-containing protein [Pyrinomonadaceae bacterium]